MLALSHSHLWRGVACHLQAAGVAVLEVTTPDRHDRRRRGKNDDLDAQNAAHAAFAGQRTVTPEPRRHGRIARVLRLAEKQLSQPGAWPCS